MNLSLELLFSVLLIVVATAMTRVKGLFALMVLLSMFSGLMACMFGVLGAADVGFTEAVVGACVSTLFLMALFRKVDTTRVSHQSVRQKITALAVAIAVAGMLLYGLRAMPVVGSPDAPLHNHLAQTYMTRAYADMKSPNVVTAVLADYRGFDTLMEVVVVVTAALACLLILRKDKDETSV